MIKKTPTKSGNTSRVTFELPAALGARTVHLCGEFNDWSETDTPLIQRKDGRFSVTVTLPRGRSYRFRYLINGEKWENDWEADTYVPNVFGGEDSVVEL